MIDLHSHTLMSDGQLVPAEHVRRAMIAGYEAIGITDHADSSNIERICKEVSKIAEEMKRLEKEIIVLPGLEITHVLPEEITGLVNYARGNGIKLVLVHGETPVEPVREGTNRAAIEAGVNILAHPGFIKKEDAELAAKKGVMLEITARKGHSLTNGHVAATAIAAGAGLVIDTDSHSHNDFISKAFAEKVLLGAAIPASKLVEIFNNSRNLVKKIMG